MATDKPRFSVTFTENSYEKIRRYQKDNNISTQSKAVAHLVELALNEIESENNTIKPPSPQEVAPEEEHRDDDSLREVLLQNFDQLNQEGQERLVETSDDMVSSGKYIKSNPDKLGNEKYA